MCGSRHTVATQRSQRQRLRYQSHISAAASCKRTAGERASLIRKLHSFHRFAQGCRSAIPNEINSQKQNQYISVLRVCGVHCHPKSRSCAASAAVLPNHSRLHITRADEPSQLGVRAVARIQNSIEKILKIGVVWWCC
ncbi:hypothetical protein FOMG_03843 [Fusarium oxysporum f. sp. melonis 26406]|uniref:Uncharacterized protein n=1 Tax=Fusarium oxysporum f. sp. melonis 26406 TaxID=1089452 RepID=X0AX14_FUSOX|nr:hypothetical protein FOMG_03843 [Fusarium oxysporum f. sp. melonis 26406]